MIATFISGRDKKEVVFNSPTLISDLILQAGINFDFPCSEKCKCGKCKIKVLTGVSPITEEELRLLNPSEIKSGIRLACCTFANTSLTIEYNIEDIYCQEFIYNYFDDKEFFSKYDKCFLSYDIGTTTLEFKVKKIGISDDVFCFSFPNPQRKFGDNVISRIDYAKKHGANELHECVRKPFEIISEKINVEKAVVTGNTTMLHFFNKDNTDNMATYPFTPQNYFGYEKSGIYFPPCISSFIGADILCGALKSDMLKTDNSLLVDIGTNGEMMFFSNGKIKCCSVAAGPAFEGFSIRNGVSAKDGAICKVYNKNGKIAYETIGNSEPTGITGSGIIDSISAFIENGIISKDGYMKNDFTFDESEVYITPKDIRNVQLAKASIRAGVEMLCDGCDINKVYIAGNFGNALNIENCIRISLFPESFKGKTEFIGNASLDGAFLLEDEDKRSAVEDIASKCECIELAGNEQFAKKYIDYINF